jgi:hypothetical protein
LGDLHMGRLLEREQHRAGDIFWFQRDSSLAEIRLFERPVAAMAFENNIGSRKTRKHLGYADSCLREIGPQSIAERPDACFTGGLGRRFRDKPERADRAHVDDVA